VVQARCLELEAELSKLTDKIQKDDHNELVKRFSNLEITRTEHIDKTTALLTENKNLKAQINEKMKCVTKDSVTLKVLAPGVNSCTDASGSKPRSTTKKNRISPAKSVHKKKVEEHPRTNKSSLNHTNHVDSNISSTRTAKIHLGVCYFAIRVTWARPMRNKGFAVWDWGKVHMECWGEVDGTVQVRGSVRQRSVGVMGILAGNSVGG
nr:hypothetical protein [Tanacetum cinerariifolium]